MTPEHIPGKIQGIFGNVFDLSPDCIIIASPDFTILLANQKACAISGYSVDELLDRNLLESIDPADRARMIQELATTTQTGELRDKYIQFIAKDGTRVPIEYSMRWFDDLPGIGRCTVTIGRDITARLQYEKAYTTLLDNILHIILVFQEGTLVYANPSAVAGLGMIAADLGTFTIDQLADLVDPVDRQKITHWHGLHKDGLYAGGNLSLKMIDRSGKVHWMDTSSASVIYYGRPTIQISIVDTTEQKLAEDSLHKSMQRYQALAEAAQDGIYIIDRNERFTYINAYGAKMAGATPEQIIGRLRTDFFPQDTATGLMEARNRSLETGLPFQKEDQVPTAKGLLWFNTWFVPLQDENGIVSEVLGIARNITSQKEAEEILKKNKQELEDRVKERTAELISSQEQLKKLTQQIVTAQEEERHRVARELHDEAGQALITLALNLASIRAELETNHPKLAAQISLASKKVDETAKQVRSLSHSLRPPILDVAGLNLGLEEFCSDYSIQTGIPVTYTGSELPDLPETISISLYRILQEALTNIAKHARPTQVEILLEKVNNHIRLVIQDDGSGFDLTSSTSGIGLLGMRERLSLLGGTIKIDSTLGQGTTLEILVPFIQTGGDS